MTTPDFQIEYRLRWVRPGSKSASGRTRYYVRRPFAERAALRYAEKGYAVQLDHRTVRVLEPWAPYEE